ncbi:hypothetical protein DFP72DRAFT_1073055 [Ephemerocybe angulata]|uniref:RRM domain-containing protein n=1 Tax=Ephemerocybe angulata TaxID=980116 RepID=A0A8H6HMT4_9AGAR|nr:hypothetical protein DFP72DRAFT_1073055 [Tulosesus angulatus]
MASHVMNATLRLSQRATSRKISHVLSGNTRSLSSTSSSAARACATRNAAFATAFSSSTKACAIRAFSSNSMDDVPDALVSGERRSFDQREPREYRERGNRRNGLAKVPGTPSKTFYVAGLPFFTTEEDLRDMFAESGNVEFVKVTIPSNGARSSKPFAHVTMSSLDEAVAIVESAKEEPFEIEGRRIVVDWAHRTGFPPSNLVYFSNFNDTDMTTLRQFLGPLARSVNNAWFNRDKATNTFRTSGLIVCRSVEDAQKMIDALDGKAGPDGSPVMFRFGKHLPGKGPSQSENVDSPVSGPY